MKITFDDNWIFTVGEDGVIVWYEIKDKDAKIKRDQIGFAEEFLIQREKYKKKIKEIEELRFRVKFNLKKLKYENNLLKI